MKHRTIFVPLLMPKLSDQAATHLVDILEQLLGVTGKPPASFPCA